MHRPIVYVQFRYRNSAQAIYILSVQYGYCGNMQYAIWLLSSLDILQVGLDAISLLLGPWPCAILHHIHFACTRIEVLGRFGHDNYFREKKNSKAMTQKKIAGIKAYLKNVEKIGWQQPYCNSHTAHSICVLCKQYVYCLRIVPISKLRIHNMQIARNSHTECDNASSKKCSAQADVPGSLKLCAETLACEDVLCYVCL